MILSSLMCMACLHDLAIHWKNECANCACLQICLSVILMGRHIQAKQTNNRSGCHGAHLLAEMWPKLLTPHEIRYIGPILHFTTSLNTFPGFRWREHRAPLLCIDL